jgi:hypothetical protein
MSGIMLKREGRESRSISRSAHHPTIGRVTYPLPNSCRATILESVLSVLSVSSVAVIKSASVALIVLMASTSVLATRPDVARARSLHAVGRKFDRFWDVAWFERPLRFNGPDAAREG